MDVQSDRFARGMVATNASDFENTPQLDQYQYDLFRRYVPGNARILEIGAGTGRITELLLNENSTAEYMAAEPSDHFFSILQERFRSSVASNRLALVQLETPALVEMYPGHFDVVFSVHVMEHIEDDFRFVSDCAKLLKPGGKLIVLVPAIPFLYSAFDKSIGHYRRYDKRRMRSLLADQPLELDRLFYSNLFGVIASLFFIKFGKIEYSSSASNKARFTWLTRIYSRAFIPGVQLIERVLPVPLGLNLTLVATRR